MAIFSQCILTTITEYLSDCDHSQLSQIDTIISQLFQNNSFRFEENCQEQLLLHRELDQLYANFPFPVQKVGLLTHVRGGRGDLMAGARCIRLIQEMNQHSRVYWCVEGMGELSPYDFLDREIDRSRLSILNFGRLLHGTMTEKVKKFDLGLLITGPVKTGSTLIFKHNYQITDIHGPRFNFFEVGSQHSVNEPKRFDQLFHVNYSDPREGLTMGLRPGSGMFIDKTRSQAILSRAYCCPEYLKNITDESLKSDLSFAFGGEVANYDLFSLNFGYAHIALSWERFIDFTAMHERKKHVIIILNQKGFQDRFSTEEFVKAIFVPERIRRLISLGYGHISVKGIEERLYIVSDSEEGRRCTVILRSSFHSTDMRALQLASERLLTTGDNSAAEAWAARCKLYLYETFDHKIAFRDQQVKIAKTIHEGLGRVMELGSKQGPLSNEEMEQAEKLLSDSTISEATLKFCCYITEHFSFDEIFQNRLKRMVWHHLIPSLMEAESKGIDERSLCRMSTFGLTNLNAMKVRIKSLIDNRGRN